MDIKIKRIISFINDAIEGLWFNRNVVISSIVIVMSSLCLFGAYISFSSNINYISDQFKSQYAVCAYLEKGTPEERVKAIEEEISKIKNIAEVKFISEADALEECKKMFGTDYDFLNGLEEDNPLRASFEITLKDISKANTVAEELGKIIDVSWVKNNQDFVSQIMDISSGLKNGSFVLMIIFAIISIFIISNTIKISVSARKDDIYTMRYVGATNDYIVVPFIIEGLIIGLAGALIGFICVVIGYAYCSNIVSGYIENIVQIYKTHQIIFRLFVACILFGLFIGVTGSIYSVKKYIKA